MPNGAHLTLLPIETENLLRLDICFRGGKSVQTMPLQAKLAISQLAVKSLTYNTQQVAKLLDYHGATLTATCNYSCSCLTLVCLPRFLPELLPLLFSLLNEPAYHPHELDIARETLRTEWKIDRQKVAKVSNQELFQQLFPPAHPMSQMVGEEDFDRVNPDLLRQYWQHYLHCANAAIFLTGKMDKQIEHLVRQTLGEPQWGGSEPLKVTFPTMPSPPEKERVCTAQMPCPTVQTAIRAAFILPPLTHHDMPVLRLANTILGGYFGSRLMSNIREDKGFTYHIGSQIMQCPGGSLLTIGTEVKSEVAQAALSEIRLEIERMAQEPVCNEELAIVKNYMAGRACRQYEAHTDIAELLMSLHRTERTIDDLLSEHHQLETATAEDVRNVVEKYLQLEHCLFALAGKSD